MNPPYRCRFHVAGGAAGSTDGTIERNIWFGRSVSSRIHFDGADNLHFVLAGSKRITLYPPSATADLYQKPWRGVPPAESHVGSMFDADYDLYPRFRQARDKAISFVVERGEAVCK